MSKIRSYPLYNHLLVVGATSEVFQLLVPKLLPYVQKITCIGRNETILQELKNQYPRLIESHQIDLSHLENYKKIEELLDKETFDGLIQLQGYGLYGTFESIDFIDHQKIIDLNLTSLMKIAHTFIRTQKNPAQKKLLLHAASLAGVVYCPFLASYSAAKAGLIHFTETLQIENLDHFNCIALCPKGFGTKFSLRASFGKYQNPPSFKHYTDQVIEAFLQAIISPKGQRFCTFSDWISSKLFFFIPKKYLFKRFQKKMEQRA
jgi:short-subunit dehydrogenase